MTTRYYFEITDKGVSVREKQILSSRRYQVPFENIAREPIEVSVTSKVRFWVMIVLWALSLVAGILELIGNDVDTWVFWGIFALIATVAFVASRESFLVFKSGNPALVVYKDRPTPEALDHFVSEVQRRKRKYLFEHYLLDAHAATRADAIHKLAWLREQNVITDEEFEILKTDVINEASKGAPRFYKN